MFSFGMLDWIGLNVILHYVVHDKLIQCVSCHVMSCHVILF